MKLIVRLYCLVADNSDLIACTVVGADGSKVRRFLVMDNSQFILVEPDSRRLGWGVAKMAGFLQDIEVCALRRQSRESLSANKQLIRGEGEGEGHLASMELTLPRSRLPGHIRALSRSFSILYYN